MHGVAVVDKPLGPTSHDVVSHLRRVLKTKRVGHAGTLDPLASGVLVIAVGEATKLVPYLTAAEKTYEATVRLGEETLSLDAGSPVIRSVPYAPFSPETLELALTRERERAQQVPPQVSAIHIDGVRAHTLARKGEVVVLPPRQVSVRSLELLGAEGHEVRVRLTTSKGYYVRAFARDLAMHLGTVAHLTALRRIASGAFSLAQASPLATPTLLSIVDAAELCLPTLELTEEQVVLTRHGKDVVGLQILSTEPHAWMHQGALVAVGALEGDVGRVLRGFTSSSES
jgi:tRNA pseudouridine55 synthase